MDATEKKKKSFWNKLLHLPRSKSQTRAEKADNSSRRHSTVYTSQHSVSGGVMSEGSASSGESENFVTLESSALMDIHKDAGILFINKKSVENCFMQKEDNKHVQFVPTPLNKMYNVDRKSAPSKKKMDENKENFSNSQEGRPARPILKTEKSKKLTESSMVCGFDILNCGDGKRLNVKEIHDLERNGNNPHLTRTSTKLALVDSKNMSLTQLNVSHIGRYNSLPRNQKILLESNTAQKFQEPSNTNLTETLLRAQRNSSVCQPPEMANRYTRHMNLHRQSCYGISNPSRIFDEQNILNSKCKAPDQDFSHRYSLGGPSEHFLQTFESNSSRNHNKQAQLRRSFKLPQELNGNFSKAENQSQDFVHLISANHAGFASSHLSRQLNSASTGHIPNKAINEVGLPLGNINAQELPKSNTQKTLALESPHYVRLSETFSTSNASSNIKKDSNTAPMKTVHEREHQSVLLIKSEGPLSSNLASKGTDKTCEFSAFISKQENEEPAPVSVARKKEIKSAINMQKKRMFRKMCKYKSELCEDGFSSMADDECSFNCSCQTCALKQSRSYKKGGLKNLFSTNKSKYFFIIEPDIKEGNEIDRLTDNQILVGNKAKTRACNNQLLEGNKVKTQPHDKQILAGKKLNTQPFDSQILVRNKAKTQLHDSHVVAGNMPKFQPCIANKCALQQINKVWYNCDDSLCSTPNEHKSEKSNAVSVSELPKTPSKKFVDDLYENVTGIINSAKKTNLTPQDVKRILSTPLKSPFRSLNKSTAKSPRVLFQDAEIKSLDESLKRVFTPDKNSDCLNDSIVLLQEIFFKLSQECQELLQPNISICHANETQNTPTNKYVNDLVKNLKSNEMSEADFALVIGGIAQSIFSATKAKQEAPAHSPLPPDIKKPLSYEAESPSNPVDTCNSNLKDSEASSATRDQVDNQDSSTESSNHLPQGWSITPTTESSRETMSDAPSLEQTASSSRDSSKYSESDMQLLEDVIRVGMGLSPMYKSKKSFSPSKKNKYKSKDVLSGKGKLKLKIYNNSGLVTVFVMKAAKLSWTTNRELNSYVKITMVPDESKRVHWRTNVQKAKLDPIYNQKFSFEVFPEDEIKRLVFSVWHRDYVKQRSELIGCMSFSIKSVMDNKHNVDGWYRLLREKFGTQKHFAAYCHKANCIDHHSSK